MIGVQDLAVAAFALAGVVALGRKVWRAMHPPAGDVACPNCATGTAVCTTREPSTGAASPDPTRH